MTSLRSKLRDLRTHRAAVRAHERSEAMRHHPSHDDLWDVAEAVGVVSRTPLFDATVSARGITPRRPTAPRRATS